MRLTGIEVQARREALGLTQFDLATALGVSQASVAAWEAGRRRVPDGIHDEIRTLEDRLDALINRMMGLVAARVNAGQEPHVLLVHPGKIASGPVHDTYGPALPAAMQRVAAARAKYELAEAEIDVSIASA